MNSFLIKYHFLYYSSFFNKSQVIKKDIISLLGDRYKLALLVVISMIKLIPYINISFY